MASDAPMWTCPSCKTACQLPAGLEPSQKVRCPGCGVVAKPGANPWLRRSALLFVLGVTLGAALPSALLLGSEPSSAAVAPVVATDPAKPKVSGAPAEAPAEARQWVEGGDLEAAVEALEELGSLEADKHLARALKRLGRDEAAKRVQGRYLDRRAQELDQR